MSAQTINAKMFDFVAQIRFNGFGDCLYVINTHLLKFLMSLGFFSKPLGIGFLGRTFRATVIMHPLLCMLCGEGRWGRGERREPVVAGGD